MSTDRGTKPLNDESGIANLGGLPLSELARAEILSAILDRRFVDRLPPEDKLAQLLSVSRTTVRAALNSLEREGVVTRRRAIGTTINRHIVSSALMLQNLVGFDSILRSQGHDVDIEIAWWKGKLDEGLVTQFNLRADADYMLTEKSYLAGGRVPLYTRDVILEDALAREPESQDIPASLFEFSRKYCVDPIDHAVAQITIGVKSKTGTKLSLDEGVPFVRLYEAHYSRDAQLLAHSVVDVDDAFIKFDVFRRPQL